MQGCEEYIIDIIAKLMYERDTSTKLSEIYDTLFQRVHDVLPHVLDSGIYTYNAKIVRNVNQIIADKKIFLTIPELAGKTIISLSGSSDSISNLAGFITECKKSEFGYNKIIPMVVLPESEHRNNSIYAVTYMDRLVELTAEEYKYIVTELQRHNMDICKLVKAFVAFSPSVRKNLAFLLLPEHTDLQNDFINNLVSLTNILFVVPVDTQIFKNGVFKLVKQCKASYLIKTDYSEGHLQDTFNIKIAECTNERAKLICKDEDIPCINYLLSPELRQILLDVDVFRHEKKNALEKVFYKLNEDSLVIDDENLLNYRADASNRLNMLENGYKEFEAFRDEVVKYASDFDDGLSRLHKKHVVGKVNTDKYVEDLLSIFFKCICAEKFTDAQEVIQKLKNTKYPYTKACEYLLCIKNNLTQDDNDLQIVLRFPDNEAGVAKLKFAILSSMKLHYALLPKLAWLVYSKQQLDTAEEFYWLGKKMLNDKDFASAKNWFEKALVKNCEKAGDELIKLAKEHPECGVNIESLAENLVPEANYRVGLDNIGTPYGETNLALAARSQHRDALKLVADRLYNNLLPEDSREKAEYVIEIYEFLNSKCTDSLYNIRIGLLYYRIKEYSKALERLDCESDCEALYYCAQMYQYGYGVRKNLNKAYERYVKVIDCDPNYEDAQAQYDAIKKVLEERKKAYNSNRNSYRQSKREIDSSEDCVITTATCNVLQKGRDCDELNMLRSFRDSYIIGDGKGGDELIAEYRRIAPGIVESLAKEPDCEAIYGQLWIKYILPSCAMVKENRLEEAKKIYIDMVKTLCEKYNVQVKDSIVEKYSY